MDGLLDTSGKLQQRFATNIISVVLVTDIGWYFMSTIYEFKDMLKKNEVKHIQNSDYHPFEMHLKRKLLEYVKEK